MSNYIVLASAFRANLTPAVNMPRHTAAKKAVKQLTRSRVPEALGSFKEEGQAKASKELSLVCAVTEAQIGDVCALFFNQYQQDACLVVNTDNAKACLVMPKGETVELGHWQEVTKKEAESKECYTFFDGKYWYAK